jgi:hypothetical protein
MKKKKDTFFKLLRYMSLLFVILISLISIIASGGGRDDHDRYYYDDDGRTQTPSAPIISDLSYSPASTTVGGGGGTVSIDAYIDFADDDGNISTVTTVFYDADNNLISNNPISIPEYSGLTSGTIEITYYLDTSIEEDYYFEIYVTDTNDLESNTLTGIFSIVNKNAPILSNLSYSPESAMIGDGGGSIDVDVSLTFSDINGDLSTMTFSIYDSEGYQLSSDSYPAQDFTDDIYSGTIDFIYNADTSVVCDYSFEIYITDLAGNNSNSLSGDFSVTE